MGFTLGELKAALASRKGTSFVTIVAETDPRMNKRGNPYLGRVTKRSTVNGAIGWLYPSSVNRQREREDLQADFESHPRKWGERIKGTPFVEHKGSTYLELKVENVLETQYLLDGEPVDRSVIQEWLPKRKSEGQRQEVATPVICRDYKLDTIKSISMNGTTIVVG
jgi:hypothetical protein